MTRVSTASSPIQFALPNLPFPSSDKPKPPSEKPSFADTLTAEAGFTVDVWELLTDIEFVLLHKGDSRSKCIDLVSHLLI